MPAAHGASLASRNPMAGKVWGGGIPQASRVTQGLRISETALGYVKSNAEPRTSRQAKLGKGGFIHEWMKPLKETQKVKVLPG